MSFTKSSFCGDANCVEVDFRKSTFCHQGGCVEVGFHKSSFCGPGSCVEVSGTIYGTVLVRDSKDPRSPVLEFDTNEWAAFLKGVKAGEFDLAYAPEEQL